MCNDKNKNRTSTGQFLIRWFAAGVLGIVGTPAHSAITPLFSVRPEILPVAESSRVLLTMRTTGSGTLTPASDQFTFTFDAAVSQITVLSVDPVVTLHVGAASTLGPTDFQVTQPAFNQVRITYTAFAGKTFAAGETISVGVVLTPTVAGVFSANVGYVSALQTAAPATGDTLSFVDFPTGPPGPQGPPGPPGGSVVHFSWDSVTGQVYQLQFKTNLLTTNWNNADSEILSTNTSMSASDPIGPDPQRFYRLKQP